MYVMLTDCIYLCYVLRMLRYSESFPIDVFFTSSSIGVHKS